jgi:hypothetical protein
MSLTEVKSSIIKKKYLLDTPIINNFPTFIKNKTMNDLLLGFCNINEDNDIMLNYSYLKIIKQLIQTLDNNFIIDHVVEMIELVLTKNVYFTVHVSLKLLTISDIEKYYSFISNISERLKKKFPDKLEKCFIYNAPFIFSQIFNIISSFVDKPTIVKIQLVN